jgi:hypothetical protein
VPGKLRANTRSAAVVLRTARAERPQVLRARPSGVHRLRLLLQHARVGFHNACADSADPASAEPTLPIAQEAYARTNGPGRTVPARPPGRRPASPSCRARRTRCERRRPCRTAASRSRVRTSPTPPRPAPSRATLSAMATRCPGATSTRRPPAARRMALPPACGRRMRAPTTVVRIYGCMGSILGSRIDSPV